MRKTKVVYFKKYVIDYIRKHKDYIDPAIEMVNVEGRHYCTIQLDDDGMYYSRDFDVPYFVVYADEVENDDDFTGFAHVGNYYIITEPKFLKGLHVSKIHVTENKPFEFNIDDKMFEI